MLASETNLGSVSSVSTRAMPSTSILSVGRIPDELKVAKRSSEIRLEGISSVVLSTSIEFDQPVQASWVLDVEVLSSELRKRQTAAQSSILEVGYLVLHDKTAASTREQAA